MPTLAELQIGDDLHVTIGRAAVRLTPSAGLRFAEDLLRKSMRLALAEEVVASTRRTTLLSSITQGALR